MNRSLCSWKRLGNGIVRHFHRTNCLRLDPKNVEEVKIPVPWGHIAGEWWGSKEHEPIFALHGYQDNAQTWDPFLRCLPADRAVLAIDFPGCGFSSHYPPFLDYNYFDNIFVIRLLQKFYGLRDVVLLGHSRGSAVGFLYSCIFPESVKGFFGVDVLLHPYRSIVEQLDRMTKIVDRKVELGLKDHGSNPTYDWDVIKNMIVEETNGSINEASAEILMKRGTEAKPDGKYSFRIDIRLTEQEGYSFSVKQAENLASNIRAHTRLVKATKGEFFDSGIKHCPHILDIIKSNAKSYECHILDGDHDLHLDTPEALVPIFVELLKLV